MTNQPSKKDRWIRRPQSDTTVVFIHGINSDRECWKNKETERYWFELLEKETNLSTIGIYLFSYQTGIFSGNYNLSDVVDLLYERFRIDKVINSPKIIFVCHSMGGIIARQFLVREQVYLYQEGLRKVGLFLVASPSLGSNYANMLGLVSNLLGNRQAQALQFSQSNVWLNDLDKNFMTLKEKGEISVVGKELIEDKSIVLQGRFWRKQVVEPFSGARYFYAPLKVAGSNHFTIATPQSETSIQHEILRDFIENFDNNKILDSLTKIPTPIDVENQEDNNNKKLIKIHESRLQILKEQAALKGQNTPPEILLEIQKIKEIISELKRQKK